jgi:UDP-N-acetylmuramate dehydrogenase
MNPIVSEGRYREICRRLLGSGVLTEGQEPPSYPAQEGHRKLPAAWLIERAGIRKGWRSGRAGISEKHVLAIVNCGEATAAEVRALAAEVQERVHAAFGVKLGPEPVFIG